MSFYLSNTTTNPTGLEPAEFLDLPLTFEDPGREPGPRPAAAAAGATRAYAGAGITVHWDATRCIHAERCTSGAPTVFDRDARPWVDPDGARADEIAAVIDTCPSGALSYTRTDGAPNGRRGRRAGEDATTSTAPDPELSFVAQPGDGAAVGEVPVTIAPQQDGPLVVEGAVALVHPDGSDELAGRLTLCRCGHSGAKPRCDGSHVRVGFRAPGVTA